MSNNSKYYRELKETKERLINDINYYVALEGLYDGDAYDGYEDVHIIRLYEDLPCEYVRLTVRRYCENYVLAYTDDYDLVKEFNGRKWFWTPEDHRNLLYVGNYIIKIPYKHIPLHDLYLIADSVCNEDEDSENICRRSFLEELSEDDD